MENFYIQKFLTWHPRDRNTWNTWNTPEFCAWCEKSWLSDPKKLEAHVIQFWIAQSPWSPQSLRLSSLSISMFSIKRLHFETSESMQPTKSRKAIWTFSLRWLYQTNIPATYSIHQCYELPKIRTNASMKCPQNYATGTGSHFDSSCETKKPAAFCCNTNFMSNV